MDDYLKIPLLASLKSGHFAFFGDETPDITSIEQLAIYATFERKGKICEHFIGILPLSQMFGTTLSAENIMKVLVEYYIVYSDKTSNFSELFEKDGSISIHYQNIPQLATEMFKVSNGLCPEIVKGLFQFRNEMPYNLKQRSQFHIPPVRTVFSGTESIKFLGPKIWELIPDEMKELESLWEFKRVIKLW